MIRIESLLAARLFLSPQWVADRLFFISNLSGRLSLYSMRDTASVPEPLLPPDLALPNPELLGGHPYYVYPQLAKILVMIDQNGDEVYRPHFIPLEGGYPEPIFADAFAQARVHCAHCDIDADTAYFVAESQDEPLQITYRARLNTLALDEIGRSTWGLFPVAVTDDQTCAALVEGYTTGDTVLHLWQEGQGMRLLAGKPLEQRAPDETVPLTSFFGGHFTERGLLLMTSLFEDAYGVGYLDLNGSGEVVPVTVTGTLHSGMGEMEGFDHQQGNRYRVVYNIDGASWVYEGAFDEAARTLSFDRMLVGQGELANGVLKSIRYDKHTDRYALSFSTATSPTQIYTIDSTRQLRRVTNERPLGLPQRWLSPGEDASFTSHDGLRVSARLYLPAAELGYQGARPLVYYVHGGPQGQERPNFAWFSMPLIQFLTMNGFAVFVPNARGSTGYGLSYTKHVDQDWGGQDRLDHVHAMKLLGDDPRIDTRRAAVVGRSYGGYMTLTLASRHPELWSAAVDMFGPYNLITFSERIPETWKPYFTIALGDPSTEAGRAFLTERSPSSYIESITCPMLIIQGANDPRVVEAESRDVADRLRAQGKPVELIVFEDEGHDVLRFENRVTCYNAITDFFKRWLKP